LLVALIAILGLTAMATGGFLLSRSDSRTSENHKAVVEAFYLAETGLNEYIGSQVTPPPASWSVTLGDGSAELEATLLTVDASGRHVYRVVSTGRHRAPRGTVVERTVGKLVRGPTTPGAPLSEIESSWFQRL
jgi:Tfp pilus assembly protein PilX